MAKKKPKDKPFRWTEPRIEVANLVAQGKSFMEIIAEGYSRTMASLVMNALKRGEKPSEESEDEDLSGQKNGEGKEKGQDDKEKPKEGEPAGKGRPLIAGSPPKSSPIRFTFAQKEIILDPLELHDQYRYYLDLDKRNGGITETFSQVLTLGMQVLWVLHQDIPLNPEMLKVIFTGAK